MNLDELLASPEYTSAAPDDRMRQIDLWALASKQEFPDQSDALDAEVPKLRAREYVTAALPQLGVDQPTAQQFAELYKKANRPQGSNEPEDWNRYDAEYAEKESALNAMAPDQRQKFAQFSEVMERAGRHYQTAEEARNGMRQSEIDYGSGVKIPLVTKTLHDRKAVTITYPDGSEETFEYALDEPPPDAERLRTFMVQNRADRLGGWGDYLGRAQNFAAHATNAAVDMTASGLQFADALTGEADAAVFGGKSKRDAAITVPLFIQRQTGRDGQERWVKRSKPEFLADMDDAEFRKLQGAAVDIANGRAVDSETLDAFYMHPALSKVIEAATPEREPLPAMFGGPSQTPGVMERLIQEQVDEGKIKLPEDWAASTEAERREIGRRLAGMQIKQNQETRETVRPFDVDPANLLATQEDQKTTTGQWGTQVLDWLGDKAFNIPTSASAIGSSLPGLAAAIVGGPAASLPFAGLMGASEGNQAFEETLQKNLDAGMDAETARNRALQAGIAYGAVAAALEQAGSVVEANVFRGGTGGSRMSRLGQAFAPEVLEEGSQSAAQDLIVNANIPDELKKSALDIAKSALEAGAGALTFGIIPGMGALRTPADQATEAAIQDPDLPDAAKAAVAESADLSLETRAQELSRAAQAAIQKPDAELVAAEEPAPATEAEAVELDTAIAERTETPLTYADEGMDAIYRDGAWTLPDGTPAPNAEVLEAGRREYIQTGKLPEGMQEAQAPEMEAALQPEPVAPGAPETELEAPSSVAPTPEAASSVPPAEPFDNTEKFPTEPPVARIVSEQPAQIEAPAQSFAKTEQLNPPPAEQSLPEPQQLEATPETEEVLLTAEPPAPTPGGTSRPARQPRTGRKRDRGMQAMQTRAFKTDPTVANDIISKTKETTATYLAPPQLVVIKEKGKPRRLDLAPAYRGGEWDWYRPLLEDPTARRVVDDLLFAEGATTSLDTAASNFGMRADEYGQALADAAMERVRIARSMAEGQTADAAMESAEKQTVAFEKATAKGKEAVTTWDLQVGDELEVEGEPVRVVEITEDGDAVLRDGTRFGEQLLKTGDAIWVEKHQNQETAEEQEPEPPSAPGPNPFMRYSAAPRTVVTPEQDAAYLTAVERGDIATAQRMLAASLPDSAEGGRMPNEMESPYAEPFVEGVISADKYGENPYVYRNEFVDPNDFRDILKLEGLPYEIVAKMPTTERYIEWYRQEYLPPPIDVVIRYDGRKYASNRRRVVAALEAGVSRIPSRVEIGRASDFVGTRDAQGNVIPLSQWVNPQSEGIRYSTSKDRTISRGASKEDVQAAVAALKKMLPNVANAWIGTRAEVERYLANNPTFKWQWKQGWKIMNPGSTDAQANDAFDQMLKTGLDGMEGFTFKKRTYIITDQVGVRESDGTPAKAVRRILIHEDAHEGLQHLRDIDNTVEAKWQDFRNAIDPKELDALAASKYPWLTNWRNSPEGHDEIADEWFAARIAEIEKRGEPAPDSLTGRFIAWLKGIIQKITGDTRNVTNRALLEFIDAARAARFRDRAEANAQGLRYSATNQEGDMAPKRLVEAPLDNAEEQATQPSPEAPTRYDLFSKERRAAYEEFQKDPAVPESMKMFTQFLGNPTTNQRLRQSLPIMVDYARATLGGINGESPAVTDENTETAWQLAKDMLTRPEFAGEYRRTFQQDWSPKDSAGRAQHGGDAAVPVLQMELMDYAVRMAAETGDTRMMSLLYPFANDVILADYQTMSGAARALQVRSMAVREAGVWKSLRLTYAAIRKAAEDKVGAEGLTKLEEAVDSAANPELNAEVQATVDTALENSPEGMAVVNAVDKVEDEYDTEGYWERVLSVYSGEERADLYNFWTLLNKINRKVQLLRYMEAQAGSQVQPSMAEDARRYASVEQLKAELEADKKEALRIMGKLTAEDTSGVSKAKRREILGKNKAAVKLLSETQQARKMLERFENRNKRLKRDKPAWRQTFEAQVKNPKGKDEFLAAIQKDGVAQQTSQNLYDLAAKLHAERAARPKSVKRQKSDAEKQAAEAQERASKAEREATRYQREAERMIEAASKEPGTPKEPSALRGLQRDFVSGKIGEQQFRDEAATLKITPDTLDALVNVSANEAAARDRENQARKDAKDANAEKVRLEAALKTYGKKITGEYQQSKQERASELRDDLKEGKITQAEYDAQIEALGEVEPKLTDTRAFISSIARQILETPLAQQADPTWKRQTIINAFRERGMSPADAEKAANSLAGLIEKALREGQAKAAIKTLKTIKKAKKVNGEQLGQAIRSAGIDPLNPNPVIRALAEQAGYKSLTPEQFRELARLDTLVNSKGATVSAKAYGQMGRILGTVMPRKTAREILTQTWINSALSSLGVISLNWIHPIYTMLRRQAFELAGVLGDVATGKTKAADVPAVVTQQLGNWLNALSGFKDEAVFALKNDAYRNRVLDMLSSTHRMYQEMQDAAKAMKTGTPAQKVKATFKWLATSTDYMRRILAAADQSWGGVLQQYVMQNEAMRMLLQEGGMSAEAAATILNAAALDGQGAMAKYLAAGGDATEARLVAKDAMQESLGQAVAAALGRDSAAEELITTGQKEASTELGNRLPEQGGWFDLVNGLLEMFKSISSSIRNRKGGELVGRMLTGFITVGANVLNRSAYFSPLGIARALYRMNSSVAQAQNLYSETMGTEGQARMRLIEGIVGTLTMAILMALRSDSDDEDGIVITGEGPSNKSVKDAWMKRGHKPSHIELVIGGKVVFSISYTRGGLDHMAIPLTMVGALDDMQLDGKKGEKKNAGAAWSYGETLVGNLANQARFFGMKNLVSSVPTSLKDSSIAGNIAYMAAPFVPWSGLIKSTTRLLTGQQDQSSWNSAILAQIPFAPLVSGQPALNFLGDPVGPQSKDFTTKLSERLEYSGAPFFVGIDVDSPNADIYAFINRKGVAPSVPMRGVLESANGLISDRQWRQYLKLRGNLLKDSIRSQKDRIQFMPTPDAADAMEEISREATKKAKKALNLK